MPSFERGRDEKGLGERFTCLPMSEGLVSSDFHLRRQSLFGVAGGKSRRRCSGGGASGGHIVRLALVVQHSGIPMTHKGGCRGRVGVGVNCSFITIAQVTQKGEPGHGRAGDIEAGGEIGRRGGAGGRLT